MSNEGWIDIEDRLPKIGEEVQVNLWDTTTSTFKIGKSRLKLCGENNGFAWSPRLYFTYIKEWRPIPEKTPDFSKLNVGDFIIFDHERRQKCAGIIVRIKEDEISIAVYMGSHSTVDMHPTYIKKITRINLKDKTLEEI